MPRREAKARRRSDLGLRASKCKMCLTRDEKSRRRDDSGGWEAAERRLKPSMVTDSGMVQGEPHVRSEVARKPDECWRKEEGAL